MSLYHLVREPKEKLDKNPALILLHGYGSNEEDLFTFASELPEKYYIISIRAPHSLQPYGYAWYSLYFDKGENKFSDNEQAIASRDEVVEFIDSLPEQYAIDENDITLLGFSQGSILSYAVALSYPEKVKRVVAMSGYMNTDIIAADYKSKDFSNLRMFVSHGTVDQTVPVAWARKAPPVLKALNIDHEYKEYPVGHGVAPENFYDVLKWLEQN